MHILLTDQLTCPRCGPDFGLIVLSDKSAERHVLDGSLGCANCRSTYPIVRGIADLRLAGGSELAEGLSLPFDPDRAVRVAALLGVTKPNATILILERSGATAAGVSALLPEVHVIGGSGADSAADDDPSTGVLSRVRIGDVLPFRSGSLAGVAAIGIDVGQLLADLRRALRPDGRIVVEGGGEGGSEALWKAGFEVHLEQDGVVVASPVGRS